MKNHKMIFLSLLMIGFGQFGLYGMEDVLSSKFSFEPRVSPIIRRLKATDNLDILDNIETFRTLRNPAPCYDSSPDSKKNDDMSCCSTGGSRRSDDSTFGQFICLKDSPEVSIESLAIGFRPNNPTFQVLDFNVKTVVRVTQGIKRDLSEVGELDLSSEVTRRKKLRARK